MTIKAKAYAYRTWAWLLIWHTAHAIYSRLIVLALHWVKGYVRHPWQECHSFVHLPPMGMPNTYFPVQATHTLIECPLL